MVDMAAQTLRKLVRCKIQKLWYSFGGKSTLAVVIVGGTKLPPTNNILKGNGKYRLNVELPVDLKDLNSLSYKQALDIMENEDMCIELNNSFNAVPEVGQGDDGKEQGVIGSDIGNA